MSTTPDTIHQIRIDELHDSPFNPRRDLTGLDELAASITAEGRIHEPLLVRPRLANILRPDEHDGYEIVFGHRRAGAAAIAGLASAPCMVRSMTDSEVRSAQIAENLQRENIHALEEAESFRALMEADSISADALAQRLGKSRSHVYGRLKLNALCAQVRDACREGKIGAEVALLIARLRTEKLQAKALQYIAAKYYDLEDGGAKSYRHIRALLNERFALDLKGAMFDTADALLLPDAGACSTCPKRTANAPEFADVAEETDEGKGQHARHWMSRIPHGGANVCTDPDCFDAKKKAHLKNRAAELAAKGKTVIDGNAARAAVSATGEVKGAYMAFKDVKDKLKKAVAAKKTVTYSDQMPKVVLIQDPRTGKTFEAVKREDLKAAGAKIAEPRKSDRANYAEQEARRAAERKRNEARATAERNARAAIFAQVRERMATADRNAFDLRLIAEALLVEVDYYAKESLAKLWGAKDIQVLQRRLDGFDMQQLAQLALDCALVGDLTVHSYSLDKNPLALLAAAAHYGVDVDQVRAQFDGEQQPSPPAAPAAKKTTPARAKQPLSVKYRCPDTHMTWSGRGLQPAWVKAALKQGRTLAELEAAPVATKEAARAAEAVEA